MPKIKGWISYGSVWLNDISGPEWLPAKTKVGVSRTWTRVQLTTLVNELTKQPARLFWPCKLLTGVVNWTWVQAQ